MKRAFILVQLLITAAACGGLPMLGVSGESIVNANGEEVILRGMNMDLYYGRVEDNPASALEYAGEEDIQYLSELGCTPSGCAFTGSSSGNGLRPDRPIPFLVRAPGASISYWTCTGYPRMIPVNPSAHFGHPLLKGTGTPRQ